MDISSSEFVWSQKYRPKHISDCILPEGLKNTFLKIVESKNLQHMLFSGTAGLGKTTVAQCLALELDCDFMMINASEENGIDVLRNKIRQYASSVSLQGGYKIVLLDEADRLTPQVQDALKGFIEEFSSNCRFILTSNFKNKIISPLHSRTTVIEFNTTKAELAQLSGQFLRRLKAILDNEKVTFDKKVVADIIIKFAPDWRRVINECQKASTATGDINASAVLSLSDSSIASLMLFLKNKDFKSMRSWVVENMDIDAPAIFRKVYDSLSDYAVPATIPQAVLIIADYSYKNSFVVDREINTVACMTELMASVEWK